MKLKRRQWAIIFVATILGVAVVMYFTREREPVYEGRTLSEWLKVADADAWAAARIGISNTVPESDVKMEDGKAWKALNCMGTNAIPFLLRWIEYDSSAWDNYVWQKREVEGNRIARWVPDWMTGFAQSRRALLVPLGFHCLGDKATPAIPRLTELLKSQRAAVSQRATAALFEIGTPGTLALIEISGDTNAPPSARQKAIKSLGGLLASTEIKVIKKTGETRPLMEIEPALLKKVEDSLLAAANDRDESVRKAVTNAVEALVGQD